jgi:hypothetical protein
MYLQFAAGSLKLFRANLEFKIIMQIRIFSFGFGEICPWQVCSLRCINVGTGLRQIRTETTPSTAVSTRAAFQLGPLNDGAAHDQFHSGNRNQGHEEEAMSYRDIKGANLLDRSCCA